MNTQNNLLRFDGRNVIVTGGTRGIGKAIAELYYSLGAQVTITGRGTDNPMADQFDYCQLDCSDADSVENFIAYIDQLSCLDVLVNNAGINKINVLEDIDVEDFDNLYAINLRSPFLLCKAAAKKMKGKGGHILNIASIWSKVTREGRVSYISSKSGLAGMTRGMATDLARDNILVNTLSPGFVGTDLTYTSLTQAEIESLCKDIPIGRLAAPSEIANQAIFLTSELNTYLTGRNIIVDGGFTNV